MSTHKTALDTKAIINKFIKNSKSYITPSGELYIENKLNPEKGAFPATSVHIDPIMLELAGKPCTQGQKEIIRQMILAEANKRAIQQEVFTRFGHDGGARYLDLGKNGVAKVTKDAIKISGSCPVPFRKPQTMRDLPLPDLSGDVPCKEALKRLKKFINLPSPDIKLVIAWLMSAFCPSGTKPVLIWEGCHGSGMTLGMKYLLRILDPHEPSLVSMPSDPKALFINASNRGLVGFDNVSKVSDSISDFLCQLASGGAITSRKLYTDGEQFTLQAQAQIAINGISAGLSRMDLLDRTIRVESGKPETPMSEAEIEARFQKYHPVILGATLRTVQYGLRHPQTAPSKLKSSRLVDFIDWTYSWAPALEISASKLVRELNENQKNIALEVLSEDMLASVLFTLLDAYGGIWQGLSTGFYETFMETAAEKRIKYHTCPASAAALSSWLTKESPALAQAGIHINRKRKNAGTLITVERVAVD